MNVAAWLPTANVIDWILAGMLVELLALAVLRRRTRRGLATPALLVSLIAGAALLLALRASLTASGAAVVEGWLLVALAAHLADLKMRWSGAVPRRL